MKKRNGLALLLCLLLLVSVMTAMEGLAEDAPMIAAQASIDHAETEARARNDLQKTLHCPASMELLQIDEGLSHYPALYTPAGEEGFDPEHSFIYDSVLFSYTMQDGIEVIAHAAYNRETKEMLFLSLMHCNPNQVTRFDAPDIATQEMVDAVIAQVEMDMNLTRLTWNTREKRIGTNWGACIRAIAATDEDHLLTVFVGCSDGRLHGLEIKQAKQVDALPDAWYERFAYDDH